MVTERELTECVKLVEKPSNGNRTARSPYEASNSEHLISELRFAVKMLSESLLESGVVKLAK